MGIKSFIKSQGLDGCEIYSDDGYSAKNRNRPALKRLVDDASEKHFDAVLVYKIDRLSRRLKNLIKKKFMAELPAFKRRKEYFARHIVQLNQQKDNLLKWMGEREVKPYILNAINEKLERIEPELNDAKYELMKLEELFERRSALVCSSKNVARDIEKSLANFSDFSFGEKKRFLCEVIHKTKVNSKMKSTFF